MKIFAKIFVVPQSTEKTERMFNLKELSDMETKINIAKILNDKPEGTKLWTDMFGIVTLYVVTDACDAFQVKHHNKEPWFDEDGKLYKEGVLCIYPSKSMRDWSKFAWKKGDILVSNDGKCKVIFERFDDDTYTSFVGKYYVECYGKNDELQDYEEEHYGDTVNYTKESEEAAQTYINTIEERLGGKLNHETLEIENAQPEFKDGDIVALVVRKCTHIAIFQSIQEAYIGFHAVLCQNDELLLEEPFREDVGDIELRLATDSEKKQLFSALEKEGKAWDSDKKVIVDLNPNIELKPFDRVLVRDFEDQAWQVSLFSYKDSDSYYCCNGCSWDKCIPYIGNESLLGTTKDVEG